MWFKLYATSLLLCAVGAMVGSDKQTPRWKYFGTYVPILIVLALSGILFLIWSL